MSGGNSKAEEHSKRIIISKLSYILWSEKKLGGREIRKVLYGILLDPTFKKSRYIQESMVKILKNLLLYNI